jgi:hypothetical protein
VSTPDRALAALVVALVAAAALLQPVWRAIDPRPAQALETRASFAAGAATDPWGTPWERLRAPILPQDGLLAVCSAGPNRISEGGNGDDLWAGLARERDGAPADGLFDPRAEQHLRAYERGPLVPLALATALLLTRLLSGLWPPTGRSRGARLGASAGLALLPFAKTFLAAQGLGVFADLTAAAGAVVLPPALAAGATLYALTFALVHAHRELSEGAAPTTGP